MRQRTLDLIRRRTAVIAVVAAVAVVLAVGALAFRGSSAGAGAERPTSQADLYKTLNDPKQSGLDPRLAARLAGQGAQIVTADVTGVGRDAYPDYWAGGNYRPCCSAITIHAAGARRSATHPNLIDVIVAWSAQRLNHGPALTNQTETITLRQTGPDWRPIHPELLNH
jgi:hypothetical protein